MDAPAIPPVLIPDEAGEGEAEDDWGGPDVVGAAEDDAVAVEAGANVDTGAVPELVGTPLGPRFTYASQSALGKARGQLSS